MYIHDMPNDILYVIMDYLNDIQDYINFMITSNYIYKNTYAFLITKKFKFMMLYHQTPPSCSINNKRVKHIKNKSDPHPFFITTDESHTNGHCQFYQFYLYELYGFFFIGLHFNNFYPEINHNKLMDIISHNDKIININSFKKIYSGEPYIKEINLFESYKISKQFIKNKEYYRENNRTIKILFNKFILNEIRGHVSRIYGITINPDICIFCGKKYENNGLHYTNLHNDWRTRYIAYNN